MELENQEHDAFKFSLKMIAQLALQININIIYEFLLDLVMSPKKFNISILNKFKIFQIKI